jgi:predicted metal-binding membrane protein
MAVLTRSRRREGGIAVLVLAAAAWVGLWVWTASPLARYLHHDATAGGGGHDPTAAVADGPGALALFGLFVGGWTLMLVAMMLPTTRPLMRLFAGVVRGRPDRVALLGALAAGYLAVWLTTGVLAYLGDIGLHTVLGRVPVVGEHGGLLLAAAVGLAGAYQFAPMKLRCLEKCRSPRMFVFTRWRGRRPLVEALRLGAAHGRFCVGCCWALMLVMFAIGLHGLGWMAVLAAVMAVEKNAAWGERIREPVGYVLLAAAALLVVLHP